MSIIYRATRIGLGGKPFTLYKIRTMVRNAAEMGGSSTADNDPRITPVGHFLRKTKLDELPQLWNLLRGDMRLIGWRPEAPEYLSTLSPLILATKPGIVGLATLDDFDEGAELALATDPDKAYREKILPRKRALELYYAQNQNLWLDAWILWKTFLALVLRRHAKLSSAWFIGQEPAI